MRILFIGTVMFSRVMLEKLISMKCNVAGVVTKRESKFNADFADLFGICRQAGIPIHYADNVNHPETMQWMAKLSPDIIFCFGWSSLLKKEALALPQLGVLGYHPAELPKNRGRHPLIWALALGLEQTGSTFFFMDQDADSGDILSQKKIPIAYEDDAASLYEKITSTALVQVEEFMPLLEKRSYKQQPQDHSLANYWRKRGPSDGLIDFRMSSRAIYNLVRALTKPYIGANLIYKGAEVKIWKTKEMEERNSNIEPGKVISLANDKVVVKTYDGAIEILHHEFHSLPQPNEYL